MPVLYRRPAAMSTAPESDARRAWGNGGSSAVKLSLRVFREFFVDMPWGNGYFPATRGSGSRDIANKMGQR